MDFLVISGCDTDFKCKLHQNYIIQIDIQKLHMKFSALNIDFDGPSLDFLGSRKPAHESIKEHYLRKCCYFIVIGQPFVETVADRHGHAAYHNKH